ncbi:hypothetical protein QFZ75_002977 [Streptomyces sp. V3I8]|uniref:hypothetical protein n=1 Tax=Streptomyces sp. V3I8 TaxID=3042279 RepID=UPI0027860C6A|nr:hypothetical protein [Streptomyces sp. V3I8]MDQ1036561.1 hypothetical protein [Streptomyces sp. V3I8]
MASAEPDRPDPAHPAHPAHPADPLAGFVPDPAARAELARRMSELAGLVEEAGDALGEILAEVQRVGDAGDASRGRDSAERSRGASRSST